MSINITEIDIIYIWKDKNWNICIKNSHYMCIVNAETENYWGNQHITWVGRKNLSEQNIITEMVIIRIWANK